MVLKRKQPSIQRTEQAKRQEQIWLLSLELIQKSTCCLKEDILPILLGRTPKRYCLYCFTLYRTAYERNNFMFLGRCHKCMHESVLGEKLVSDTQERVMQAQRAVALSIHVNPHTKGFEKKLEETIENLKREVIVANLRESEEQNHA